jgi:hypothetical protein
MIEAMLRSHQAWGVWETVANEEPLIPKMQTALREERATV